MTALVGTETQWILCDVTSNEMKLQQMTGDALTSEKKKHMGCYVIQYQTMTIHSL